MVTDVMEESTRDIDHRELGISIRGASGVRQSIYVRGDGF